jgi:dienelactone hydrolase
VVLHILDGRFIVARMVCMSLANAGLDALLVKLPFYGPRRPPNVGSPAKDPERFRLLVFQGIADTRRAAALLAGLATTEPGGVGLCGVSLGGFVAALTAGIDGNFERAAFVLAGGELDRVMTTGARETRRLQARFAELGLEGEGLRAWLRPMDPCTFAPRLRSCDVLMVNVAGDEVVPAASARALARDAGDREIVWFEGDQHTALLRRIADVMLLNREHFTKR